MTMIRPASKLPAPYETLRHGLAVSADLRLVCLWSALGLTLSGLFFVMGFGADIARAFMVGPG